jgi:hypothetical protein
VILPCPPCPDCGARVRVDYDTTLRSNGRCVETLLEACEHERKRRGVCRYCSRPVGLTVGRAIYCKGHAKEVARALSREASRRKYARNPEKELARVKAWREQNRERVRRRMQEWRAEQKRRAA